MFDVCRDIQLLEQLGAAGFRGGLFVMHVDDPAFYQSGLQTGIYSFFRAGARLTGTITKPTGAKDQVVRLRGSYSVRWQPYGTAGRYWLQTIAVPNNGIHATREENARLKPVVRHRSKRAT